MIGLLRLADPELDGATLEGAQAELRVLVEGPAHDRVGGGFFGPGLSKPTRDNALALLVLTRGASWLADPVLEAGARGVADWLLRDMLGPDGAFWAGEGPEDPRAPFYRWTEGETPVAVSLADGLPQGPLTQEARDALFRARLERLPPATLTELLPETQSAVVRALALSGRIFAESSYVGAARGAGAWLAARGCAGGPADLGEAMLELHASTGEPSWLDCALEAPFDPLDPPEWRLALDGAGSPALSGGQRWVVVAAPGVEDPALPYWLLAAGQSWIPGVRVAVSLPGARPPLLLDKNPGPDGEIRAWSCLGTACVGPTEDLDTLMAWLEPPQG